MGNKLFYRVLVLLLLAVSNVQSSSSSRSSCEADAPELCVLPREESLCRVGFVETCTSAVCYDSGALCEALAPEELGFLSICLASEALAMMTNCECFLCTGAESDRDGAAYCYGESGIDVAEPVRGNCEAGGCCAPELPLCELERYFFFMSLAYGVAQSDDSECTSSLDYFGPDHDCTFLTDGKSNDAIVCSNADITQDDQGRNYCDITFSGTNDGIDVLRELFHLVAPTLGRNVTFGTGEMEISAVALEMIATIALGSEDDPMDGIMEIAYQAAADKGCFTRGDAAVHLMAHSLGAAVANFFVLKLAAEFPNVHVKMTTSGEPAILVAPLRGKAATLQAWSNKDRFINGRVLPRGQIFDNLFPPREYGLYQDYCWVSQAMPGGYVAENEETNMFFLCEAKIEQNLQYFIAGREGCAAGRDDVLNDMPNFPHKGAVELFPDDEVAQEMLNNLKESLEAAGLERLSDLVDFFNTIATVGDENFREAFFQILELHFIRRSVHTLNLVYQNGERCEAVGLRIPLPDPVPKPCTFPFFCFSGDTTVEEMSKGTISMRELEVGDMVKNANGEFDIVYSFGHYAPETKGEYIQVHVSNIEKPLDISTEHMLFVEGFGAIPASTLRVGDKVVVAGAGVSNVTKITKVIGSGAFAPFTMSGTIAVNGVAASTYISLQKDAAFLTINGQKVPFSMHTLAHVFQTPHRVLCKFYPSYCMTVNYTRQGMSPWVAGPLRFSEWLLKQNTVVQVAILLPCFALGLLFYAMEFVLSRALLCFIAGVAIAHFLVRFPAATKPKKKEQ